MPRTYRLSPRPGRRLGDHDATGAHARSCGRASPAGVPTFCEKPVAAHPRGDHRAGRPGRGQRRAGARRLPAALRRRLPARAGGGGSPVSSASCTPSGPTTHDQAPPRPAYIPTSGGIFRDCNVHDFDIIRFVTGREVASVFAGAPTRATPSSPRPATSTPPRPLLTLDDGTIVLVSATRYNGAGHDVRMEVHGSEGTVGVGFDDSLAVRSVEADVDSPRRARRSGPFMERFLPAYRAELDRLHPSGRRCPEPVHRPRRARGVPDRRGVRAVAAQPPAGRAVRDRGTSDEPPSTWSRWDAPASTSTRSTTASGWRTCETFEKFLGGSATNVAVAAARHGLRAALVTRDRPRPVRPLRAARGRAARRRPGVHRDRGRRPADPGDVLRGLPARRLPAVLLPVPDRPRPA